jgi:hypothetical protein
VKEKDPNELFFSADENPVPLPSVEDAWSDMRKKLDEEMPDRAAFLFWKRVGLASALLLLSFGLFWFVARRGTGIHPVQQGTVTNRGVTDSGALRSTPVSGQGFDSPQLHKERGIMRTTEKIATRREKEERETGSQKDKNGVTAISGGERAGKRQKEKIIPGQQLNEKADKRQTATAGNQQTERSNSRTEIAGRRPAQIAGNQQKPKSDSTQKERTHTRQKEETPENEVAQNTPAGREMSKTTIDRKIDRAPNRRNAGTMEPDAKRSIIDTRLPLTGNHDPINIAADVPRKPARIPGRSAATGKTAATPKPTTERSKKTAAGDSTRILWAAGLQDSKSFPVGAQQPVDYNANLKKDLWFDYIPSPYFQYFVSKRVGFQIGIQFNSPQYTENVSIYKGLAGGGTGLFVDDTVLVVKKLYYLSLPLTVYYSPIRNLYLGAGLQYSSLRNGVAFQNNVIHYTGAGLGQPDSVKSSKVIALKDYRPAYSNLKRTDWRALFELDYYWKRVTLEVQYQQGLGDYLYTPVDGSAGKDRNSSFNVYLRYNIWERRIKIAAR